MTAALNLSPQVRRSRTRAFAAGMAVACALLLAACAGRPVQDFAGATPRFDPMAFFIGNTQSWGVLEARDGAPTSRLRARLNGRRDGDTLVLVQDFTFEDGRRQRRVWRLRQIDANRFDATADDVIGVATGYAYGNAFRWDYTLQTGASALTRVRMQHWMYLSGDGQTLLNRVVIRKFGVRIGGVTEYFQRAPAPTPSIAR